MTVLSMSMGLMWKPSYAVYAPRALSICNEPPAEQAAPSAIIISDIQKTSFTSFLILSVFLLRLFLKLSLIGFGHETHSYRQSSGIVFIRSDIFCKFDEIG